MTKKEIMDKLSTLPKGGITIKRVKNNSKVYEYYFLQWTENGKQKSKSIKIDEIENIKLQLEERKRLERLLYTSEYNSNESIINFNTQVLTGETLSSFVKEIKDLKKRNGYQSISDYIYGKTSGKVFILYGLRRTGKTTLIRQIISDMDYIDFSKTAFIQITKKDSFASFNKDMILLRDNGYKYIFVDEVTFMEDFIEGASLLSDIYASSGMKIILSGNDSLGFWITKSNELYDRCIFLHTTFIPYREFSNVLDVHGIDNYIKYGGTMSVSGNYYNVFDNKDTTDEYIDSAIAQNIQHSLRQYKYEGYFRHLLSLYEKDELTGAINRVVEDMNHRFTIEVLEREFKSNDLRISANNLRKDRFNPTTILDDIDITSFTSILKDLLEIKNKEEMFIKIDEDHVREIEEYLMALDLIDKIKILDSDTSKADRNRIVFTQPGLRYSQAKSLVLSLSMDSLFRSLSAVEQKRVLERILNEIKGRMTEDIVLLETKLAKPQMDVFKLQFPDGEFDMVVLDPNNLQLEIYEIKYSEEVVEDQARHLKDEKKCESTTFRFGTIVKKGVLYRGKDTKVDGIVYQNIEEYLNNLGND